jgi:hypothetical protein
MCCYKNVCSSDDIKILLKLTQLQYNTAVEKLIQGMYITKTGRDLKITSLGRIYIESSSKIPRI